MVWAPQKCPLRTMRTGAVLFCGRRPDRLDQLRVEAPWVDHVLPLLVPDVFFSSQTSSIGYTMTAVRYCFRKGGPSAGVHSSQRLRTSVVTFRSASTRAALPAQVTQQAAQPRWPGVPAGAVLGCIRPSRFTCASATLAQLTGRILPRLGTRFGLCTRAPTCSPGETGDRGSERPGRRMKASATRPEPIFFNPRFAQLAEDVHVDQTGRPASQRAGGRSARGARPVAPRRGRW